MAREPERDTGEEIQGEGAETSEQEGVARRVAGRVRRVVGAIGRAARGAAGLPEAGTDILFLKLHADHEEVSTLFEKIREAGEGSRAEALWRELAIKLTLHARAEQQTIYDPLSRWEETKEQVGHAFSEHAEIERRLQQVNQLTPGTEPFLSEMMELEQTVRHHVDDEEGELLPRARAALSDQQLEMLVTRFEARKVELLPMIEDELFRSPQKKEGEKEQKKEQKTGAGKETRPRSRRQTAAAKAKKAPRPTTRKAASGKAAGETVGKKGAALRERTYDELMEIARKREIPGRSKMKKQELVRALEDQPTDPG